MRISLIVPIFNELENLPILHKQICEALDGQYDFELLLVDDGSTDGSSVLMDELAENDPRVKVIHFRRNYGQTAAMKAGIDFATGDVCVTLDGDLQNDPADIPRMIAKLEEGYDLVHGWRKDRKDAWLHRKLPSQIANRMISSVSGFPIHDLGCTLKAIRREIAIELELYGEMHRFIPILAHARGAKCFEMVTTHHARRFGVTKYGISRTLRVILDLITVKYMLDYFSSPMKLFGRFGLACLAMAGLSGLIAAYMKLAMGTDVTGNPFTLLSILSTMLGAQFFTLGLLGEVSARIYYSTSQLRVDRGAIRASSYAIREVVCQERSVSTLPKAA